MSYATATLADFARLEALETLAERADYFDAEDTTEYIDRLTEDDDEVWDVTGFHFHATDWQDWQGCNVRH